MISRKQVQSSDTPSGTAHQDGVVDISFEVLFDLEEIQRIQDEFSAATRVASLITRPDGTPITAPSNFTDLCRLVRETEKGLENCTLSDVHIGRCSMHGPKIKPCLSAGLWDASVNLIIGERHVANWMIGQVRDVKQTEGDVLAYADQLGVDRRSFVKAFRAVNSMPLEQFENVVKALNTLAERLCGEAYHNIQRKRLMAERVSHEYELKRIAYYDSLTGLPNRTLLVKRLKKSMDQVRRQNSKLLVAHIDLDDFMRINEFHGQKVGDQILSCLAAKCREVLREGDTLARVGGDEFIAVLVADDKAVEDDCIARLNQLVEICPGAFEVEELSFKITASIGVSSYPQAEEINADQLIRQADHAMFQAKQAGKNRFHFFDVVQNQAFKQRHEGIELIRQGLKRDEFVLHYQPKVNLQTGEVFGAEALIRWQHPDRGLLYPDAFLPLTDNHRISIELGAWVINRTLAQIDTWREGGLDITVSVNVSAMQLQHKDFASDLKALLEHYPNVLAERLELEITETGALEDIEQALEVIKACRALGVQLSLDDFGTGYSSLTYLKGFPVDTIKIDRSFVRDMLVDPEDLAIVRGVIRLAEAFGRNIIAEGVETEEHGKQLIAMGCEQVQGYGIARPMPAAELPFWIREYESSNKADGFEGQARQQQLI